jgi:hypothetical protein
MNPSNHSVAIAIPAVSSAPAPASAAGESLLAPRPCAHRRDSLAVRADEISEIDIPSRPIRRSPAPVGDEHDARSGPKPASAALTRRIAAVLSPLRPRLPRGAATERSRAAPCARQPLPRANP